MNDKEILSEIQDKLEDLHKDYFFGGKKRRERYNFFMAILIGIASTLFIQGMISIWIGYYQISTYNAGIKLHNLTFSNMTLADQVTYVNIASNSVQYLLVTSIGLFLFFILIFFYLILNKNQLDHREEFSYKINEKKNLTDIYKRMNEILSELKENKKYKWADYNIIYNVKKEEIRIFFFNKIKLLFMIEYPNRILVTKTEVKLFCQTSEFGEDVYYSFENIIKRLRTEKIIADYKRIKRT
jgi:hypothetical protein